MQLSVTYDDTLPEVQVQVAAAKHDPELPQICQALQDVQGLVRHLTGFRGREANRLELGEVLRICTNKGKVQAQTLRGNYDLRLSLTELAEVLPTDFVRISHSELANLRHVIRADFTRRNEVCLHYRDGSRGYVSRRNIKLLKQALGI